MLRWASAIHDIKTNQIEDKMQRKRDAHKVKLREEKEIRRLDAIERENKRRTGQKSPTPEKEGEEQKNEETAACKFQRELCWCIQQLEMGLTNSKPNKPKPQQVPEAERLLKILKSAKAPMAKKRQIMRASFGNYRARMQQEEKRHSEDMKKSRSLTPVEVDRLNTATFFRRATTSPSLSNSPRFVSVQPVILETDSEEVGEDKMEGAAKGGREDLEEEEDVLMKSLELETMDMHLCRSEDTNKVADAREEGSRKDIARHNILDEGNMLDRALLSNKLKRVMEEDEVDLEEDEKENIPSWTPTDTDDTAHSQISSNFSSSASLFSFNFEIKEEDIDRPEGIRDAVPVATTAPIPRSEMLEGRPMTRGLDNRGSDSTSSSGGTPTKRNGRKRNRGKRKQQPVQQNQDNQQSESKPSSKEALVLTDSPKIEMAAREGFKFDFPEPTDKS